MIKYLLLTLIIWVSNALKIRDYTDDNESSTLPELTFNEQDNYDCIETVEYYYQRAFIFQQQLAEEKRALKIGMAHLLDRQEKYEVDLTGNEDFATEFAPSI